MDLKNNAEFMRGFAPGEREAIAACLERARKNQQVNTKPADCNVAIVRITPLPAQPLREVGFGFIINQKKRTLIRPRNEHFAEDLLVEVCG
jgi:hypothetical protein